MNTTKKIAIYTCAAVLTISAIIPISVFAKDNSAFYSLNDIMFYNENATECAVSTTTPTSVTGSSTDNDRLKDAARAYGEVAMDMEREFGVPWEVVIAQLRVESSVGTTGVALHAANNWLGIRGTGDAGIYHTQGNGSFAVYTSVAGSIKDWAGTRVLRNGYYDAAFPFLDPNNYNLDSFLTEMISHYAPASAGNDVVKYKADVLSYINGPIKEVRLEKGWPSSAELAERENIPVGGRHPLNQHINSSQQTQALTQGCDTSSGGGIVAGNIVQTALNFAVSTPLKMADGKKNKEDATLAYQAAREVSAGETDGWSDCGRFVGAVMRSSGVDKDFPVVYTLDQKNYVINNPEKYLVKQAGEFSKSDLLPGDIMVYHSGDAGHIAIYTGKSPYPMVEGSIGSHVPSVMGPEAITYLTSRGAILARFIK